MAVASASPVSGFFGVPVFLFVSHSGVFPVWSKRGGGIFRQWSHPSCRLPPLWGSGLGPRRVLLVMGRLLFLRLLPLRFFPSLLGCGPCWIWRWLPAAWWGSWFVEPPAYRSLLPVGIGGNPHGGTKLWVRTSGGSKELPHFSAVVRLGPLRIVCLPLAWALPSHFLLRPASRASCVP